MAYKLQLKRGASGSLPTGSAGEPLFTTDTNDLYIGTGAANQRFQKYIASGTSSQFLKGDGSLDSTTYTPTSRTLTINGTAYDLSADRTWNVGTITSATATTGGQVAFFNGATVITSVSGLYFDGINRLGIGTISPLYNLDVTGTARMTGNLTAASLIKSGGTSSQYLMADGSTSTLTNPVTGTGTTNYLPKWTSGSAIGNSQIFDNGTSVGIGTVIPTRNLEVSATSALLAVIGTSGSVPQLQLISGGVVNWSLRTNQGAASDFTIYQDSTERARITSTGNLLINSVVDNGNRLQVTGNGYFSGSVGIAQAMTNGSTSAFTNPHLALKATSTTNNTGFVGMTFATSDNANYGYSYGALRSEGGLGDLIWRQHFNSAQGTELMRLSYAGNLGLGVTPSAWGSAYRVGFQVGSSAIGGVAGAGASDYFSIGGNYYLDNTPQYIYRTSTFANRFEASVGEFRWFTAPSGTAGNAISFTQAMTLDASGRLGINTTSLQATYRVTISGTDTIFPSIYLENTTNSQAYSIRATGTNFVVRDNTSGNDRFTIASTGAATFSSSVTVNAGSNDGIFSNVTGAVIGLKITQSNAANDALIRMQTNSHFYDLRATSTNALSFDYDGSERMRITSGGSVGIGTTSPSEKFVVSNGGSQNIEINPSFIQSFNRSSPGYAELPFYASKFSFNVGNLLVGTTTDSGDRINLNGSIRIPSGYFFRYDGDVGLIGSGSSISGGTVSQLGIRAANDILFATNGVNERVRIKSNGSVRYIPMATPASAEAGDVYYDSTSNKLRCYNGTSWNDLF